MALKLALVIPGFQSSQEDWCIPVFTNLARELSREVELHVFALRYPPRRDTYRIGNVNVHALGGGKWLGPRLPVVSMLNLWRTLLAEVEREHMRSRFAAIMGIWATESGWLATKAAKRLQLPSLVHLAGGELTNISEIRYGNQRRGLAKLLVQSALKSADLITVPSGPMHRAVDKRCDASKIREWAPGVDTDTFRPGDTSKSAAGVFTFVTVSSLIPVKGHELMLRGLARLHSDVAGRDIRMRIVGNGPLRPALENLVIQLELEGYVAFEGDVSHDALPAIYNGADAFLLGSWHESQCMAALEAMASGLPWVAPPVGALADVAGHAHYEPSGVLFTRRDPADVAAAMMNVLQLSPDARRDWGKRARQEIVERYSLGTQTQSLLQLLEELTDRR